ncbi:hypothetical protein RMCBS344292_15912 [Rhizopus microsporus]|nr:hypothetical protein RMCBS344292_15912 [Rhizopus microsporus]
MHITVIDDTVAGGLCRMNNFAFMNQNLTITRGGGGGGDGGGRPSARPRSGPNNISDNSSSTGGGSGGGGRSAYLAEFLQERWNPQAGHLDLDDLPPTSHSIAVVLAKLLTEAKFLFGDAVVTLSFARNKLWSVAPLLKITELFPNLKNLSLQDNEIAEFRSLDRLSNKLNHLQELVLAGNPIQTKNDYRNEVLKRFPSVQRLDFQPTTTATAQAFYTPSDIPVPVRSNFFGQDDSRIAAQDLLSKQL